MLKVEFGPKRVVVLPIEVVIAAIPSQAHGEMRD